MSRKADRAPAGRPWPEADSGLWRRLRPSSPWQTYAAAPALVALCTVLALGVDRLNHGEANVIMLYLLGVLGVALAGGRGPSALAAVLSVLAFNFFFVEPRITFAVTDTRYLITFAVMLIVGLVVSNLTVRFRQQAEAAHQRERRTSALYALSHAFASGRGMDHLLAAAVEQIRAVVDCQVAFLLPSADGALRPWAGPGEWRDGGGPPRLFEPGPEDQAAARLVFERREMAGHGPPTVESLHLPLLGSRAMVGVLSVRPTGRQRALSPEQLHLLEAFASQTALAIERASLAEEAAQATMAVETERLRSALLSSVSHDLRTPLAIITGALTSLAEGGGDLDAATRADLTQTAHDEARRLNRLLGNLLEMTRLEAGAVQVRKEWQPLEEVVGVAVARVGGDEAQPGMLAGGRPLRIELPRDLPLIPLDELLIEQVLVNLLENAVKYTPPGAPITLRGQHVGAAVEVTIADAGPGLAEGDDRRVFDKFYRGGARRSRGSVGLGLTICKGIVEAHGGRIWAANNPGGGASFTFTLPLEGTPPEVAPELPALREGEPPEAARSGAGPRGDQR